ncbi:VOC family protein [Streptomyces sp. P38-E01]|uniref:VOC family protein n=1 Tax=Streptomyces tardus TaxID=2780544 RepID=A0A949N3U1_9ACTN|nr:VOC family protein [Streptomyces tardus]MBU7600410.1 VOC family protein [Streptomyces tardus]
MARKIFVNLPVKDLPVAKEFFEKLGFSINPDFSDENAGCVVISDTIHVMLLTETLYRTFTPKDITDTATSGETILCLSADSREEVDRLVEIALDSGGKPIGETQEAEAMYGRAFQDPDGHHWEVMYMDMSAG